MLKQDITRMGDELLSAFGEEYRHNLRTALNSGALSGDEEPGIVAKAVLYLLAFRFRPLSDEGKAIVANLKHFV